jgi:hypothetical protein
LQQQSRGGRGCEIGEEIGNTYLIRAAFLAMSLATIPLVANAALNTAPAPIQQDWSNG